MCKQTTETKFNFLKILKLAQDATYYLKRKWAEFAFRIAIANVYTLENFRYV